MRSPSIMVGFIEPEGTLFQSANEERTAKTTSAVMSRERNSSRQNLRARRRRDLASMQGLTGAEAICSTPVSRRVDGHPKGLLIPVAEGHLGCFPVGDYLPCHWL